MNQTATGLPASIEIAWGLRPRPGKGPRPGLSLERIVDAAVRVAAAEGLGAVSMGRIAKDLGVGTMSLYRYVAAKDELLVLMAEAAYGSTPPPVDPDAGWRVNLTGWAGRLFEVSLANSWVLRMPVSGPPVTPNQLAWLESGLAALRGTGLTASHRLSVMLLLTGYVRTEATVSSGIARGYTTAGERDAVVAYGRLMARLVTPQRFPTIAEALAAGFGEDETGPKARFDFGLARILDGVDALVRAEAGSATP